MLGSTSVTVTPDTVDPWTLSVLQSCDDVQRGTWQSAGAVEVSLNTGAVRLFHELDFDVSPGTAVGDHPALVYHSGTVEMHPILEGQLWTDPDSDLPDVLEVRVRFHNGPEQLQSFDVSGGNAPGTPGSERNPLTIKTCHLLQPSVSLLVQSSPHGKSWDFFWFPCFKWVRC